MSRQLAKLRGVQHISQQQLRTVAQTMRILNLRTVFRPVETASRKKRVSKIFIVMALQCINEMI